MLPDSIPSCQLCHTCHPPPPHTHSNSCRNYEAHEDKLKYPINDACHKSHVRRPHSSPPFMSSIGYRRSEACEISLLSSLACALWQGHFGIAARWLLCCCCPVSPSYRTTYYLCGAEAEKVRKERKKNDGKEWKKRRKTVKTCWGFISGVCFKGRARNVKIASTAVNNNFQEEGEEEGTAQQRAGQIEGSALMEAR